MTPYIERYSPQRHVLHKFYVLPEMHKGDIALRPIVSNRGTSTYGVGKELATVLRPLVGKFPHHIQNTEDFIDEVHMNQIHDG